MATGLTAGVARSRMAARARTGGAPPFLVADAFSPPSIDVKQFTFFCAILFYVSPPFFAKTSRVWTVSGPADRSCGCRFDGHDATVTVEFINSSLAFQNSATVNGYNVTGDVAISVAVPVYWSLHEGLCFCCKWDGCSGTARISATVGINVQVACVECAIKADISNIAYTPMTVVKSYNPSSDCSPDHFQDLMNNLKPGLPTATTAGLYEAFGSLTELQRRVTCGCVEVCPMGSNINGSFATVINTTLTVAEVAGQVVVTGNHTAAQVPAVQLSVCQNCTSATFYGQGPMIQAAIVNATQAAVSSKMSAEASSFNVPVVVQPFPSHPIYYGGSLLSSFVHFPTSSLSRFLLVLRQLGMPPLQPLTMALLSAVVGQICRP